MLNKIIKLKPLILQMRSKDIQCHREGHTDFLTSDKIYF